MPWVAGGVLAILALVVSGCSRSTNPETVETSAVASTTTALPVEPTHTPSPIPPAKSRVVLLASTSADPGQVGQLQDLLSELVAEENLEFQTLPTLSVNELTPDLKVVVALSPDAGLAELAEAAPETKFIVLGVSDLSPAANISQVSLETAQPDQQGFLAGYLAAVVTPDWRLGVMSSGDTPAGKANRAGFVNGVIFYCGLCRPAFPPFVQYPLSAEVPPNPGQAELQAAADSLIAQGVTTIYVSPELSQPALFEYLAQKGVNIIGTVPAPDGLSDQWIATIRSDWQESLRQALEQAIQGEPWEANAAVLSISDVNEALFSIGRQRIVEQVRDELAAGLIDTGVDPLSGELK